MPPFIVNRSIPMITLPSLNDLPSKWNEIRERLETDFSDDLEALLHERFTEH